MRAFLQTRLMIVLSLLFLARLGGAAEGLTARDRKLFAWFDRLGYEDFSKATLARVRTGDYFLGMDGKPTPLDEPRAFLLSDKNGSFQVLRGDLRPETFQHKAYAGYRKVTAAQEITALRRAFAEKVDDGFWQDSHLCSDDLLVLPSQAFVLARYLAANHQERSAAQLLREVERRVKREDRKADLFQFLQEGFAYALTFRAWMAYADPSQSRWEIVRRLRLIDKECWDGEEESPYLKDLEAMAKEDDAHPALSEEQLEKLPPAEQARELVFQLRNHSSERPKENHAFDRLVKLGQPAIPELLAALNDERLIRTIEPRRLMHPFPVERRAVAVLVLDEIAGVNFFWIAPYDVYGDTPERLANVRKLAADWGAAVAENREAEWFEARVAEGGNGTYCQEPLERRFPDRLQAEVLKQLRETADPVGRTVMVRRLRKLNTPEVNEFLRAELKRGTTLELRAAAAQPLVERHDADALAAMVADWHALPHPVPPFTDNEAPDSPLHTLRILLTSGTGDGCRAVLERWPELPWNERQTVLTLCEERLSEEKDEGDSETRRAARAVLVRAVVDESIADPVDPKNRRLTVAEVAAKTLTGYWPAEFHYEWRTKSTERAVQIAKVRREAIRVESGKTR